MYQNISVIKTNAMKYLPNYINKNQLEKIFICFADPHFKENNHRRRIISPVLLTEYAYFLKPYGRIYTITDVKDLNDWYIEHGTKHPNFRIVPESEYSSDKCVNLMMNSTEEGKKVERNKGNKYVTVFERLSDDEIKCSFLS